MRGRSGAVALGGLLLSFLLATPTGVSVNGSGDLVVALPVHIWGTVEADAPRGGLSVVGEGFDAALQLARGHLTVTRFELPRDALGGAPRRVVEREAWVEAALFDLAPGPAAQLLAQGEVRLTTERGARLAAPEGDAFAFLQGADGVVVPMPAGSTAVEAGEARLGVEGPFRVLFTDAEARVRQLPGAGLARAPLFVAPGAWPSAGAALPLVGASAEMPALPEVAPLALSEVAVQRVVEVVGEGSLVVHAHGARALAFSRAPSIHVLGAASLPAALGDLALGAARVPLRGEGAQFAGDVWLRAQPSEQAGPGARRMQVSGSIDSFAVDGRLVELTPRVPGEAALAAAAALGLASPLLKPLAGRVGALFYARIPPSEVLGSGPRRGLFELMQAEPGLSASELAQRRGLSWGAAVHHLETLRRNGFATSARFGRYRRWFAAGGFDEARKSQVAVLRNAVTARVAQAVLAAPGSSQKRLAVRLGMTPQATHWHLARLEQAGLVERRRNGREVLHFVRGPAPAGVAPLPLTASAAAPTPARAPAR
jgi:DNA-binding MarR family transcriptional regulator